MSNHDPIPIRDDPGRRSERWAAWFVAFGVALRVVRFLSRYPLWHDEAFIAANFIDRDYGDLAGRLDYLQVCPILFLWIELTVVKLFGFSEWTLRAFPALCGIGALVLFRDLARRTLPGLGYPLAVAILAVSYAPLRHGNEVKSYATDLFVAIGLLLLAVRWLDRPDRTGPLWWLAIAAVPALASSFPAIFVVGGILVALALPVWRTRSRSVIAAWVVLGVVSTSTFFILLRVHLATAQSEELRVKYLLPYWSESFPPLRDGIAATLAWAIKIHSGNLLAYPVGGQDGASVVTLLCVIAGVMALIRGKKAVLLGLLLVPFGLNLAASAVGRYPYGGESRIAQHLAPAVCLLAGFGLVGLIGRSADRVRIDRRGRLAVLGLGLIGGAQLLSGLIWPYHMKSAEDDRSFARWFWSQASPGLRLVETKTELGLDLEPKQWITGISASYLCNRAIYSPRRSVPAVPEETRFVIFQVDSYDLPFGSPMYLAWLDRMGRRPEDVWARCHRVNGGLGLDSWKVGRYWVLDLDGQSGEPIEPVGCVESARTHLPRRSLTRDNAEMVRPGGLRRTRRDVAPWQKPALALDSIVEGNTP